MHSDKTEKFVILHVIVFQTETSDSKLAVSQTTYNNLSRALLLRKMNTDCNLNNFKKQRLRRNLYQGYFNL